MTQENLTKLAKQNIGHFHNDHDLAEYIAFLFSELAELDSGWNRTLENDLLDIDQ